MSLIERDEDLLEGHSGGGRVGRRPGDKELGLGCRSGSKLWLGEHEIGGHSGLTDQ